MTANGFNANSSKITNVQNGTAPNDAVNLSQLNATKTNVAAGTNVKSVVASDNTAGGKTYTINANGSSVSSEAALTVTATPNAQTNITDYRLDLSQGSKDALAKANSSLQSWSATVNNGAAKTISKDSNTLDFANGTNTVAEFKNGSVVFSTAKEVNFDKVTVGTAVIDKTSGINAGGKTIQGVVNGVNGTDAVNKSQLDVVNTTANAANNTANSNKAEIDKGTVYAGNSGTAVKRPLGETLNIVGTGTAADSEYEGVNVKTISKNGNAIEVRIAKNPTFGNIKATDVNTTTLTTTGAAKIGGALTATGVINANGGLTVASNKAVNMGGNTITNVGKGKQSTDAVNLEQLQNAAVLKVAGNSADTSVKLHEEETLTIAGGNVTKGNYNANNVRTVATDKAIQIQFAQDPVFNNVTANGKVLAKTLEVNEVSTFNGEVTAKQKVTVESGGVEVTDGGVTINGGGLTLGSEQDVNMGGSRIQGVKAGEADTDAVNLAQLNAAKTIVNAGDNTEVEQDGNTYTVHASMSQVAVSDKLTVSNRTSGHTTTQTLDLSDAVKQSLTKADSALQDWTAQVNGNKAKTLDKDNKTLNFINGTNIVAINDNGNIKFSTADDVSFNQVTVGQAVISKDSGINAGGKTIQGVANGVNATDAVNLSQLNATKQVADNAKQQADKNTTEIAKGWNVTTSKSEGNVAGTITDQINLGETVTFDAGKNINITQSANKLSIAVNDNPSFTTLTTTGAATIGGMLNANGGLTVAGGQNVNMGANRVQGVAAGTAATDAVNLSQLNATKTNVAAGSNVRGVVESDNTNGGKTYTVHANGTTVNATDALTVTSTDAANNVTNYQIDLSDATKANLTKANSAVQSFKVNVAGTDQQTVDQTNNTVRFANGENTVAEYKNGAVVFSTAKEVNFEKVTVGSAVIDKTTGINAGGKMIQDVATGVKDTDAVNLAQLNSSVNNAGFNIEKQAVSTTETTQPQKVNRANNNHNLNFKDGFMTTAAVTANGTDRTDISFNVVLQDIDVDENGVTTPNSTNTAGQNNGATTASIVSKAINAAVAKSGFILKANDETDGEKINKDQSVTLKQGKNIEVERAGSIVTIKTKDNVEFAVMNTTGNANIGGMLNANGGLAVTSGKDVNMGGNRVQNVANATQANDAVNLSQLNASKTNVVAGTNVNSVVATPNATTGGTDYTVNANGTTVSVESALTVTPTTDSTKNSTDYKVDLSDATKANLTKANTAVQSFKVNVAGTDQQTVDQTNNTVRFANGENTVAEFKDGAVVFSTAKEVNFEKVTVGTAVIDKNTGINAGGKTIQNVSNATSDNEAVNLAQLNATNAQLNKGWNVTTSKSEGNVAGTIIDQINLGETVTFDAGKNINITQKANNISIAVSENPNFTTLATTGTATIGGMLNANGGLTVAGGQNVNMGGNRVQGVAAGTAATDAVNLSQLNASKTNVVAGTNINSVVATPNATTGGTDYTVNANGTTVSVESALTVTPTTDSTKNSTDYKVDLSDATKANLTKANTAVQSFKVNVAGTDQQTVDQTNNTVRFANGENTVAEFKDGAVVFSTAKEVNFDKVTVGTAVIDKNTGINAGGKTIQNVSNATSDNEAVNLAQLNATNAQLNKGWNITTSKSDGAVSGTTDEQINVGEQVIFDAGKNINITQKANNISIAVSENPNFTTLTTTGNAVIGGSLTTTGMINANGGLTVAKDKTVDMGGNKITNVGNGEAATDAVNKGQLDTAISNSGWTVKVNEETTGKKIANSDEVKFVEGKNINITRSENAITVKTIDSPTFTDLTATGDTTLVNTTVGGKDKTFSVVNGTVVNMGNNKLSDVGSGQIAKDSKDGVNGGDVFNAIDNATNSLTNKGLNFTGNNEAIVVARKLGETLKIVGKGSENDDQYGAENIKTVGNADGSIEIRIAKNPTFNNITAADVNTTTLTTKGDATIGGMLNANGGLTVASGKDVSMGGNRVQNVADAKVDGDAVNLKQLNATTEALTNKGLTFTADNNATVTIQRNLGTNLQIAGGNGEGSFSTKNVKTEADTSGKISIKISENPEFESVQAKDVNATNVNATNVTTTDLNATGNSTLNNLTVNGDTNIGGKGKTFNIANGTTINMGGNQITNVSKGTNATDVANMENLNDAVANVTNAGLNFAGNQGDVINRKLGSTLNIVGAAENKDKAGFSTTNVRTRTEGDNVIIELSDNPNFMTLTTTGDATIGGNQVVNGTSTIKGDQTVEGNQTVNGTSVFNGGTTFNKGFTVAGGQKVDFGNNVLNNVSVGVADNDATNLGQVKGLVANSSWNLTNGAVDGGMDETEKSLATEQINPNDQLKLQAGKNIKVKREANGTVTYSTQDNVTFSNVNATNVSTKELATTNFTATGNSTLNNLVVNGNTLFNKGFSVAGGHTIDMGGNRIQNVGDATDGKDAVNLNVLTKKISEMENQLTNLGLAFSGNEGKTQQNLGSTLNITGTASTAGDYSSANVKTVVTDGKVEIQLAENPNFNSITTKGDVNIGGNQMVNGSSTIKGDQTVEGNSTVKGNQTVEKDLTVNGDTNIKGSQTIAGDSTIAGDQTIKGSQVVEKDLTVNGNTTIGGAGTTFKVNNGTTVNMGGNTINNVGYGTNNTDAANIQNVKDAVNQATNSLVDGGVKFAGNQGETITTRLGNTLNIVGDQANLGSLDFSSQNVRTRTEGDKLIIEIATKPTFDSATVGGQGQSFTVANGTTIQLGNNVVQGVANGDISANSTDAVNGGQLFDVKKAIGITNNDPASIIEVVNPDGSRTQVQVPQSNGYTLTTYNVENQKEYRTNNVVEAIGRMNEQGIKFFHTNDGVVKAAIQGENTIDSSASGAFATAVGYQAKAAGNNAIALGSGTQATGDNTISIGTGNIVSGNNSGAIGDPSTVSGNNSYSVGNDNTVATNNTFVVGNNVTNTADNSVFLGNQAGYVAAGETTKGNEAHTSQTIGDETYQYAGGEANQVVGVVSVGNVAQDGTMQTRRVQNVAPGLLSSSSTDAINGSQLYALQSIVDRGWNVQAGIVEESNGVANNGQRSRIGAGNTLNINAGQNIVLNQNGNRLDISTSMAPNFNGLKINPNGKVDMGGNRIQNVGRAIHAGDAVNYGQFKAELGRVDNRLRSGIAGAVASASLVQAFNPSDSLVAIGGGTYRGASAVALGYSKVSDNGKIIIKVTGSANNYGDYTGGASIGYKF